MMNKLRLNWLENLMKVGHSSFRSSKIGTILARKKLDISLGISPSGQNLLLIFHYTPLDKQGRRMAYSFKWPTSQKNLKVYSHTTSGTNWNLHHWALEVRELRTMVDFLEGNHEDGFQNMLFRSLIFRLDDS
mmetsp:Transcript_55227/g.63167  ORF Transcript_55227/g.63167 Transcript_55227/m.63167 type:complete len:132 (-) Transcript_55227:134-529(-)